MEAGLARLHLHAACCPAAERAWRGSSSAPRTMRPHLPRAFPHGFHELLPPAMDLEALSRRIHGGSGLSSLYTLAAALAAAVGAALYASRRRGGERIAHAGDAADCLLIMNLSPFNQFVMARCPSLSFPPTAGASSSSSSSSSGEPAHKCYASLTLQGKANRLFHHQELGSSEQGLRDGCAFYQRTFIHAEDGGVLAIDWPSNLELAEEHGLDTTVLLIPGMPAGSADKIIESFARESLSSGLFPIVLNPRGCAGSPLTTPRVFTAADCDDVHLTVNFISKSRICTTLMAVGWGYGANMLVKYLSEEGESTPLTAAVCICNPFDLEEATKTARHGECKDSNEKMVEGLKHILERNKMLFEGKNKGYDICKGLTATSIRQFDAAISCISHDFISLEEFYKSSSCKSCINQIKIPLLCMQGDEHMPENIPLLQKLFEGNPFTNLLICSKSFTDTNRKKTIMMSQTWYFAFVIEWLAAVELAFLKGRHPLLQDHLSFKLAKDWDIPFHRPSMPMLSGKHIRSFGTRIGGLNLNQRISPTKLRKTAKRVLHEYVAQSENQDKSTCYLDQEMDVLNSKSHVDHTGSERTECVPQTEDVETGKAQKMAESVMRILDASMPGTLSEQQKQQVSAAVGRGETIVNALQEAIPEDVRGKIMSALSGLGKTMPTPSFPEGMRERMQERLAAIARRKNSTDSNASSSNPTDSLIENATECNETQAHLNSPVENVNSCNAKHASSSHVTSVTDLKLKEGTIQNNFNQEYINGNEEKQDAGFEKLQPPANVKISDLEIEAQENDINVTSIINDKLKGELSMQNNEGQDKILKEQPKRNNQIEEYPSDVQQRQEDAVTEEYVEQEMLNHVTDAPNFSDTHKEEKSPQVDEGQSKILDEQLKTVCHVGENSQKDFESQKEREANGKEQKTINGNEGLNMQSSEAKLEGQVSKQPSINVQQAWETLIHFDDSTQMAVANVFGVIENMIEQLEKENKTQENDKSTLKVDNQHSTKNKSYDEDSNNLMMQTKRNKIPMASALECENGNARVGYQHLDYACESKANMKNKDGRLETDVTGSVHNDAENKLLATCSEESINEKMVQKQELESKTVEDRGLMGSGTDASSRLSPRCSEERIDQKVVQKKPLIKTVKNSGMMDYAEDSKIPNLLLENILKKKKSGSMHKVVDARDRTLCSDVPLEYCPDEAVWKYLSGPETYTLSSQTHKSEKTKHHIDKYGSDEQCSSAIISGELRPMMFQSYEDHFQVVEPSYVILDDGSTIELESYSTDDSDECTRSVPPLSQVQDFILDRGECTANDLQEMIQYVITDVLKRDVYKCVNTMDIEGYEDVLEDEVTEVAIALTGALMKHNPGSFTCKNDPRYLMVNEKLNGKLGLLNRKEFTHILNSLVHGSKVLLKLMPQDILVEVILSALDTVFLITEDAKYYHEDNRTERLDLKEKGISHREKHEESCRYDGNGMCQHGRNDMGVTNLVEDDAESFDYGEVVGAIAAAVSTTTALAHEGSIPHREFHSCLGGALNTDENPEVDKPSIMSIFAEKAMSVAAPVVPTKEDGEVDHDRLVTMLADLGQRGGMLRFIGKAALLWGGLRGAMSLTEKLLVFLHLSERPLHYRLAGFLAMTLLLWSPIVVPLLPVLLQQMPSKNIGGGVAKYVSVIGLYVAVIILITIWGKRIHGYNKPLSHYGLRIFSRSKLITLATGLGYGCFLIFMFYGTSNFFNLLELTVPSSISISSFKNVFSALKACWSFVILVGRSIATGVAFATIEELLFRSWLSEEIAIDLGFHNAILLSGLCFSVAHWSLQAAPGLWLLSLALSAVKLRSNGDLALPIGIHAGLIAGNCVLVSGGFVKYYQSVPSWITGAYSGNPLAGALGLFIVATLAVILYPWNQVYRESHLKAQIKGLDRPYQNHLTG